MKFTLKAGDLVKFNPEILKDLIFNEQVAVVEKIDIYGTGVDVVWWKKNLIIKAYLPISDLILITKEL